MFLASVINETLESKKSKLMGRHPYSRIANTLNRAFAKNKDLKHKFTYFIYRKYKAGHYSVSGLYDMSEDKKYIVLNFSPNSKYFEITERNWNEFKFLVSQVCQHESIHQYQWITREVSKKDMEPIDLRCSCSDSAEEKEYLRDPDEIDAYAHDIAMEIKFYYPKLDSLEVLRKISKYKKIWSFKYYQKTFKRDDWDETRHVLLKKVYKWLPYVTV